MRNILKSNLGKHNYEIVAEAKNGHEAVDFYKTHRPDIVTMDITMEGKNGLDAAKDILEINPKALILMVSAINEQTLVSEAIKVGVKEFLVKPFSSDQLISAVEKLGSKL
jgi:two-component system chemotaxis response regulator CheY